MAYKEKYPLDTTPQGDSVKTAIIKNRDELKSMGAYLETVGSGSGSGMRNRVLHGSNANGVYNYLTADGLSVTIDGSKTPVLLTFSDGFDDKGAVDYSSSVSARIKAWTLPANTLSYLFIERGPAGALSYGSTRVKPTIADIYPEALTDAHVFLNTEQRMYRYSGTEWQKKQRIFIASAVTNASSVTKIEYLKTAGLLSLEDKAKLDSIAEGAQVNQNAFASVKIGDGEAFAKSKEAVLILKQGTNIKLIQNGDDTSVTVAVEGKVAEAVAADTANQATNDADGNRIDSTYFPKRGGSLTGELTTPVSINVARSQFSKTDTTSYEVGTFRVLDKNNILVLQIVFDRVAPDKCNIAKLRVENKSWSDIRVQQYDDGRYYARMAGGAGTTLSIPENDNSDKIPTTAWVQARKGEIPGGKIWLS